MRADATVQRCNDGTWTFSLTPQNTAQCRHALQQQCEHVCVLSEDSAIALH